MLSNLSRFDISTAFRRVVYGITVSWHVFEKSRTTNVERVGYLITCHEISGLVHWGYSLYRSRKPIHMSMTPFGPSILKIVCDGVNIYS